ncbi:hypothetical protein BRAS3843_210005 [Bradyrhizobium sp. STM 3843]|nr:hypothetical protein BRAS3843_210005 [Bradyrhizobium sp. STM 3843]
MDVTRRAQLVCADERCVTDGEGVWSWRLGADAERNAFTRCHDTGAIQPIPGESAQETVKTIAQGRPGVFGRTCGNRRVHFSSHAGHGCRPGIRPSLRPRYREGDVMSRARRESCARMRTCASERSIIDRQTRTSSPRRRGSSTPRLSEKQRLSLEYWVARLNRAMTAGLIAALCSNRPLERKSLQRMSDLSNRA